MSKNTRIDELISRDTSSEAAVKTVVANRNDADWDFEVIELLQLCLSVNGARGILILIHSLKGHTSQENQLSNSVQSIVK